MMGETAVSVQAQWDGLWTKLQDLRAKANSTREAIAGRGADAEGQARAAAALPLIQIDIELAEKRLEDLRQQIEAEKDA